MMNFDIIYHPLWRNIKIWKKPFHLIRFLLAQKYAQLYPPQMFIGITGSVGKTTTVAACRSVLSQKFKVIATEENLDSIFNIPQTLLKIRPTTQKVILEMGVQYPNEMDFYLQLIHPDVAIVTRISSAHNEFLGNESQIAAEKGKLVRSLPKRGLAILNFDDLYCRKMAKDTKAEVVFYGLDQKNCHIWASNIRLRDAHTVFEINYGVERIEINSCLLGRHFVYASLAAAALSISQGIPLVNLKRGLEQLQPATHRLQLKEGLGGWNVLDDTYNCSPATLAEAIQVLNELPARKRILVLGEMKELGAYSEKLHRDVARHIMKEKIDYVILGKGDTIFVMDELIKLGFDKNKIEFGLSNPKIIAKILRIAKSGDLILVKGSHAIRLDEIVSRIVMKSKNH